MGAVEKEAEDALRRYPRMRLFYLRDTAIVKLILYTSLQVGEIIQLKLTDIELNDRKGSVIVREGKGTKRRVIPLNAMARKARYDYLRVRLDGVEAAFQFFLYADFALFPTLDKITVVRSSEVFIQQI